MDNNQYFRSQRQIVTQYSQTPGSYIEIRRLQLQWEPAGASALKFIRSRNYAGL